MTFTSISEYDNILSIIKGGHSLVNNIQSNREEFTRWASS